MRAAVLGSPISHSLSPALHRAAYAELGLDWQYDAFEVDAGGLAGFLERLGEGDLEGEWAGLSLTMPLKDVVIPLLGSISPQASAVGAVNTVIDPMGARDGHNTDIEGIVWAVRRAAGAAGDSAASAREPSGRFLIIGAGATARSALAAAQALGHTRAEVWARRIEAAQEIRELGEHLGVEVEVQHTLNLQPNSQGEVETCVCTLPSRAADPLVGAVPERLSGVLLDVVYHPWPSALAGAWQSGGGLIAPGADMLLGQALEQVRLMTGRRAPAEAMEQAMRAEQSRRAESAS